MPYQKLEERVVSIMNEIAKTVEQLIISNAGWSVILLLYILSRIFKLVQIEIDPLHWFTSIVGKALTKDVRKDVADLKKDYNEQVASLKSDIDTFEKKTDNSLEEMKKGTQKNCEQLKKRIGQIEKSNDIQSVRQIRAHILDFANSCMNKRKHTQKDFENIFEENKEYEKYIKKHKIRNARYTEDYAFILRHYNKCLETNDFLRESDAEM